MPSPKPERSPDLPSFSGCKEPLCGHLDPPEHRVVGVAARRAPLSRDGRPRLRGSGWGGDRLGHRCDFLGGNVTLAGKGE
jgi:hypothetical protein